MLAYKSPVKTFWTTLVNIKQSKGFELNTVTVLECVFCFIFYFLKIFFFWCGSVLVFWICDSIASVLYFLFLAETHVQSWISHQGLNPYSWTSREAPISVYFKSYVSKEEFLLTSKKSRLFNGIKKFMKNSSVLHFSLKRTLNRTDCYGYNNIEFIKFSNIIKSVEFFCIKYK